MIERVDQDSREVAQESSPRRGSPIGAEQTVCANMVCRILMRMDPTSVTISHALTLLYMAARFHFHVRQMGALF